jgi:hypothetical protein
LDDRNFYGPALAEAHYLESEIAGYPRIVVSDKVLNMIDPKRKYSSNPLVDYPIKFLAEACKTYFSQDIDGYWIVDFLGSKSKKISSSCVDTANKFVLTAYKFIKEEADRFKDKRDNKLALRYHLLQKYFEERLPIWEIDSQSTTG